MRTILNKSGIEKLQNRIKLIYYSLNGTTQGSDDCFQHIIQKYLQGQSQHQPIKFAVLDYMRLYFRKKTFNEGYEDIILNLEDKNSNFENELKDILPIIESKQDRAMFILYYKWGLKMSEIGECFGCSEANVSMQLDKTRNIIKRIFKVR
jgi:DNA-directed RNA polymerase specialized sigma subunit